jgi:hypothetical protein
MQWEDRRGGDGRGGDGRINKSNLPTRRILTKLAKLDKRIDFRDIIDRG